MPARCAAPMTAWCSSSGTPATGANHTAVGHNALDVLEGAAAGNTALGQNACTNVTTGSNNVCLGQATANTLTTGDGNIVIGRNRNVPSASTSNYLNLGDVYTVTGINVPSTSAATVAGTLSVTGATTLAATTVSGTLNTSSVTLGSVAWASRPTASSFTNKAINVNDVGGAGGAWFASNGTEWAPTAPVPIARSAAQVDHTGTTAQTTLATVNIPAALMCTNCSLQVDVWLAVTPSINAKVIKGFLGGTSGTAYLDERIAGNASTASLRLQTMISNRNSASSQVGLPRGPPGAQAPITSAVNTASATTFVITGQLASASDHIYLERYEVRLLP